MKEIWKDIPNYENIYQASSLGRIRTHPNKTTFTLKHGTRHWKMRIMKGKGNHKNPGARVSLWKNGEHKDWLVARLIAITFLGQPDKKQTVNHKNGNRLDNRVENLEWLSLADNIRHAFDNGLMPYSKIYIYNNNFGYIARSMSMASIYIGRSKGYIRGCLKKHTKIYNKDGQECFVEILKD